MPNPVPASAPALPKARRPAPPPLDPMRLRRRMERAIERMIAALDALDAPAEELEEPGDMEPVLGAPEIAIQTASSWGFSGVDRTCDQTRWAQGGDTGEREVENENGGDILDEPHDPDGDDEPSLGWTGHVNQEKAAAVNDVGWWNREGDAEPGLGSPEHPHDQRRWGQGKPAETNYRPSKRPVNRYPDRPGMMARQAARDLARITGTGRAPESLADCVLVDRRSL